MHAFKIAHFAISGRASEASTKFQRRILTVLEVAREDGTGCSALLVDCVRSDEQGAAIKTASGDPGIFEPQFTAAAIFREID